MTRLHALVSLAAICGLAGCPSSQWAGRDPRKVYRTMQDGQQGYTRGGVFHGDVFGGGLEEVVAGNPQAAQAAETFHNRMVGGFIATMGGALCLPVIFAYDAAKSITDDSTTGYHQSTTHSLVEVACLALIVGGSIALVTAPPYGMDAVNMYNDGVDAATWQVPRFTAPPPAVTQPPGPPVAPIGGPGAQ